MTCLALSERTIEPIGSLQLEQLSSWEQAWAKEGWVTCVVNRGLHWLWIRLCLLLQPLESTLVAFAGPSVPDGRVKPRDPGVCQNKHFSHGHSAV